MCYYHPQQLFLISVVVFLGINPPASLNVRLVFVVLIKGLTTPLWAKYCELASKLDQLSLALVILLAAYFLNRKCNYYLIKQNTSLYACCDKIAACSSRSWK